MSNTLGECVAQIRAEPGRASAWFELGAAALEQGDLEVSRRALLHAAELLPQDDDVAVAVARLLADAGARAEAGKLLRSVLSRSHHRADAELALGRLQGTPAHAAALSRWRRGSTGAALVLDLHLLLAHDHERRGDLEKARAELAAAVGLDPDHLEANRRLAAVLDQLGDASGAIRCWRRVVKVAGQSDVQALLRLGIALSQAGIHTEALGILGELARRPDAGAQMRADFGTALLRAGCVDDAVTMFTGAIASDARSAPALCGLGLARLEQGRLREAAQAFEATDQLTPDSPTASFNLGLALWRLGDRAGARDALVRAAALAPADKEVRTALDELMAEEMPAGESPAAINASLSGKLESLPTSELLEFLRVQGKRGTLVISSPRGMGVVRLAAGKVTSVTAPGLPRLGETLVARGLVSQDGLETTLAGRQRERGRDPELLGRALLRNGLVDERRLVRVLFEQVRTALAEMLRWQVGSFFFHNSREDASGPLQLDLRELMMDLARQPDSPHTPVVRLLTPGPI